MVRTPSALAAATTPCLALGLALIASAPTDAAPVSPDRFGVVSYPGKEHPVVATGSRTAFTLRAAPGSDVAALSLLVEHGLADVIRAPAGLARPVRAIAPHGLFLVELSTPLSPWDLAALAGFLLEDPRVAQVHPVLTRATGRLFVDDRLVVSAEPGQLDEVLPRVLDRVGGRLLRRSRLPHTALVEVGAAADHDAVRAARELVAAGLPGLRHAQPQLYRELRTLGLPNDPYLSEQWHHFRAEGSTVPGPAHINTPAAWDTTYGDAQVVVAVFDSGIDLQHPDLQPAIVGGFDALDLGTDASPGCSPQPNNTEPSALCPQNAPYRDAHGTSVAGLAVARGDNDIGGAGVCPLCTLMPVRFIGPSTVASLTVAEAFVRAVDDGAWVINNSWGPGASVFFPLSTAVDQALDYVREEGRNGLGTVVVFAAGNETVDVNLSPYAADPRTIAVAASTNLDDFALYSNYGRAIDVAAPSRGGTVELDDYGLVTTDVSGGEGYSDGDLNFGFGGTSGASPIVAGLAGLILSARPDLTAEQVRLVMTSTAAKITASTLDWEAIIGTDLEAAFAYDDTGHSRGFGYGRVEAGAAVAAAFTWGSVGARCADVEPGEACPVCDENDLCRSPCATQSECPDGTVCEAGTCGRPPAPAFAIGQPCEIGCPYCSPTFDTELEPVSVCSATCELETDCPAGFDCRTLNADGLRVCVVGDDEAGNTLDIFSCGNDFYGSAVVAEGDDGQPYCSDICFEDDPACPYGFHCASVSCSCTVERPWGCVRYECQENLFGSTNWPTPMCVPDTGYGVTCESDIDCARGDYCLNGSCRIDDRTACPVCRTCDDNSDCGPRGICFGDEDGALGRCTRACVNDGDCHGDAVCRLVDVGFTSLPLCTAPDATLAQDEICNEDYTCAVPCREDVPCPGREVCEDGVCVPGPPPDEGVTYRPWPDAGPVEVPVPPPSLLTGCACAATGSLPPSLALVPALALVWARRRRTPGGRRAV